MKNGLHFDLYDNLLYQVEIVMMIIVLIIL